MPRPPKPTDHLDAVRHLMGTRPDHQIAELCGSTASIVGRYRRKYNIPAYEGYKFGKGQKPPSKGADKKKSSKPRRRRSKIDAFRDEVGKIPDAIIAEKAGVSVEGVRMYRRRHDIALEPSARRRRGSRKRTEDTEVAAPVAAEVIATPAADAPAEKRTKRPRRSKIDPFRDEVGQVPDSEIAVMAEVTPEAVRMYRRKHNIPATWRDTGADSADVSEDTASPAPVVESQPAPVRMTNADLQGYAVSIIHKGKTQEHIVLAGNIAEAAGRAVAAISAGQTTGEIGAIRHLGPALH
ncbi:MAG: hypothetical protein AAFV53_12060 [Myxococcota bacterium]